jgi:hypothetical protein
MRFFVLLYLFLQGCSAGPQFMNIHGPHWTQPGRLHTGVDILASIGTPVIAARSGEVRWVETDFDGQFRHPQIVIRHTDKVDIFYYHIDRLQVRLGDTVKQGQVVAYTARTGWMWPNTPGVYQGAPHLHMETRQHSGYPFDPQTLPFTCPDQKGEWWWPVGCGYKGFIVAMPAEMEKKPVKIEIQNQQKEPEEPLIELSAPN